MNPSRIHLSVRLIHWVTAALVLSLIGLGLAMTDSLSIWRTAGLQLHKIAGVLVLTLTLVRLIVRARHPLPELPGTVGRFQQRAAACVHVLLYVLLVSLPLTGWAMQSAAGNPVRIAGTLTLPQIAPESLAGYALLREAHGVLALSLLALIMVHIAGALYHELIRRDGVLRRMF